MEKLMNKDELKTALHEGVVTVSFTKANGKRRDMKCTLSDSLIPPSDKPEDETKVKKTPNPDVQPVWDIEAEGWRSFRFDSIVEVNA